MRRAHTYSPATLDAVAVLGLRIAAARRERRWTAAELADRAGVSLNTLRNVERGAPTVAMGVAFELATLLGIELFGTESAQLPDLLSRHQDRLALLPARVRTRHEPVDDDF
jgi:transcriptional regulator with XRE-family HTH domain